MAKTKKTKATRTRVGGKTVETIRHTGDKRKNIPSAEHQSVIEKAETAPHPVKYLRNTDLDPQFVWRGKDEQDWTDLVVQAPPLYIQERVHPKVLVDDLLRQSKQTQRQADGAQFDLFGDFNGIPEGVDRTEFYRHDQNWSNRMILGDSLQVMASLAEREGLRGKVQCIYIDPPYGIKFNSNFQWSTTSRDVKDGKTSHITREPEQVKAFRDTWRDGIHSYLTYLRDRLTVARDLLAESGSVFVQISNENVHRVTALMDEVFGDRNRCTTILMKKSGWASSGQLPQVHDFIVWYAKDIEQIKYRQLYRAKIDEEFGNISGAWVESPDGTETRPLTSAERLNARNRPNGWRLFLHDNLTSTGHSANASGKFAFQGGTYWPGVGGRTDRHWKTVTAKLPTLAKASRLMAVGSSFRQRRFVNDFSVSPLADHWDDTAVSGFADAKVYVVQTNAKALERCVLMSTDPGDLVLDPTCGSGTAALVAEQWGRRWITIDTSRVALVLARARILGARYLYYLLADSPEGIVKLRPQVAEYADDEPAAQLSRIPIPLRNHQSRRLALLPFRLEFPRCRRSPCRTGYHRDV